MTDASADAGRVNAMGTIRFRVPTSPSTTSASETTSRTPEPGSSFTIVPTPRSRWFSPPSTPATTSAIVSVDSVVASGVTGTDSILKTWPAVNTAAPLVGVKSLEPAVPGAVDQYTVTVFPAAGGVESESGNRRLRAPVVPSTIDASPTETCGPVITPGCAMSHARAAVFHGVRSVVMTVSGHFAFHDVDPGNAPGPSHTIVLCE